MGRGSRPRRPCGRGQRVPQRRIGSPQRAHIARPEATSGSRRRLAPDAPPRTRAERSKGAETSPKAPRDHRRPAELPKVAACPMGGGFLTAAGVRAASCLSAWPARPRPPRPRSPGAQRHGEWHEPVPRRCGRGQGLSAWPTRGHQSDLEHFIRLLASKHQWPFCRYFRSRRSDSNRGPLHYE
jgi:hypothetical protein